VSTFYGDFRRASGSTEPFMYPLIPWQNSEEFVPGNALCRFTY